MVTCKSAGGKSDRIKKGNLCDVQRKNLHLFHQQVAESCSPRTVTLALV